MPITMRIQLTLSIGLFQGQKHRILDSLANKGLFSAGNDAEWLERFQAQMLGQHSTCVGRRQRRARAGPGRVQINLDSKCRLQSREQQAAEKEGQHCQVGRRRRRCWRGLAKVPTSQSQLGKTQKLGLGLRNLQNRSKLIVEKEE